MRAVSASPADFNASAGRPSLLHRGVSMAPGLTALTRISRGVSGTIDAAAHPMGTRPQGLERAGEAGLGPREDDHLGPFGHQALCHRQTDATRSARDHGYLIRKSVHLWGLLCFDSSFELGRL